MQRIQGEWVNILSTRKGTTELELLLKVFDTSKVIVKGEINKFCD